VESRKIKKLIQLYAFWYGCLGALSVSIWQAFVLLGHVALPQNWLWVELAFSLHACAAMATFQRGADWNPLLSVTPKRIVAAKALLILATLNFLFWFSWFLLGTYRGAQDVSGQAVALVLTSFLLQNTTYIAVHWAFRPENLLSPSFIRGISDPLSLFSTKR
jgi:hypothetical protein